MGSKVNHHVKEQCNAGHCTSSQCQLVSAEVIEMTVGSVVPSKKDETCNISRSNFINGTKLLSLQLSYVITEMLQHGTIDVLFNNAVIKPFLKNLLNLLLTRVTTVLSH